MPSEPQSLLHHQHHSPLPHQFAKQPYSVLGAYAYRPMATHHPKAHQPEEMNENGDSRPSSRNSSIIDPGDEIDGQEDDGPSPKRLCLERAGSNSPSSDKGSSKNASSKGFLIKDILDNAAAASMANASNTMSTPNPLLASGAFMRPWAETSPEAAAAMAAANAHSYLSQLSMFQNALHQYQALAGLHPSLSHLFASVAPSSTATGVAGLSQMPPTSTPTTPFSAASLPGHLSHPLMGSLPSPSMMSSSANAAAAAAAAFRLLPNRRPRSADDDSRSERSESDSPASVNASSSNTTAGASSSSASAGSNNNNNSSPLDALFEMTSKAFERGQDPNDKSSDPNADHLNMYASRSQAIKKKRKSRTAFTNHQIFELEKRFLYQKYLSPADRDEIAQSLGLTNAQVITWFQNRRAKLKRDVEELKKDVDAAKLGAVVPHTALLENIQDLTLLKKPELMAALHHHHQATAMAAAAAAAQQQHQAAVAAAAAAAAAHQQ